MLCGMDGKELQDFRDLIFGPDSELTPAARQFLYNFQQQQQDEILTYLATKKKENEQTFLQAVEALDQVAELMVKLEALKQKYETTKQDMLRQAHDFDQTDKTQKVIFDNINTKLADNEAVMAMAIICHEKRCYMVHAQQAFLNDPNKREAYLNAMQNKINADSDYASLLKETDEYASDPILKEKIDRFIEKLQEQQSLFELMKAGNGDLASIASQIVSLEEDINKFTNDSYYKQIQKTSGGLLRMNEQRILRK